MPTRPTQPDPSGTAAPGANAFAGLGAGLDFFQDWMKAASSALPNMGGSTPAGNSAWSMPTLDPEELDKRIKELKTVQFWLEQNARMIGMTIQTLEVQRMTLNTLREMKVPVDALKDVLKAQGTAAPDQAGASAEGAAPGVNPMAWWGTLTEQFSTLASQAVAAGQEAMSAVAPVAPAAKASKASTPRKAASPAASKKAGSGARADGALADHAPPARKAPRR
jgi:ribosomal protein L29